MSNLAETLARKHFNHDTTYTAQRLSGGISSEIYKVEGINTEGQTFSPIALTILRDPEDWWKIEKEKHIRDLVGNDPEVLLPKLIDLGIDRIEGNQIAFLISEFVMGGDLDAFIEKELSHYTGKEKLSGLAHDVGYRIAALHLHNAGVYGLIGLDSQQYSTWQQYILSEFENETKLIASLDPSLQIGSVSVYRLQQNLSPLQALVGRSQSSLLIQEQKISHGDARFGNLMANVNSENEWRVTSLIDLEAMLGGDPELDIAFMENWLHFSSYKEDFFAQRDQYKSGYKKLREPSIEYQQKRLVYHTIRSLAYLRTVFGFNIPEFVNADPRHVGYVEKHMQIVDSLAIGNNMEDLNIRSLI